MPSPHLARYVVIGTLCTLFSAFVGMTAYHIGRSSSPTPFIPPMDTVIPSESDTSAPQPSSPTDGSTTSSDTNSEQKEEQLIVDYIPVNEQRVATPLVYQLFEKSLPLRELFFGATYVEGQKDVYDLHVVREAVTIGTVREGTYAKWSVERHLLLTQHFDLGTQPAVLAYVLRPPTTVTARPIVIPGTGHEGGLFSSDDMGNKYYNWMSLKTGTEASRLASALAQPGVPAVDLEFDLTIGGLREKDWGERVMTTNNVGLRLTSVHSFATLPSRTARAFRDAVDPLAPQLALYRSVANMSGAGGAALFRTEIIESGPKTNALEQMAAHLLFAIRPDGLLVWYEVEAPFWNYNDPDLSQRQELTVQRASTTHAVSPLKAMFLKGHMGGCGFTAPTRQVSQAYLDAIGGVTPFGTIGKTQVFALLKPAQHEVAKLAEEGNQLATTQGSILYWKDGFGVWHELRRSDLLPAAECGKPVIYLYPEETKDLTVHVAPQGGFTITEPAYHDGWNVRATPESWLTNLEDGNVYPYLFWEGLGGSYSEPQRFWVVERGEVETFLRETLARIGFVGREIDEFVAFWLPRMQATPFYKIGFHGTDVMNQIAPLTLSQEPDAVLRVLMDFTELSAAIPEHAPLSIPTFERKGFTVVEWGGVIRR